MSRRDLSDLRCLVGSESVGTTGRELEDGRLCLSKLSARCPPKAEVTSSNLVGRAIDSNTLAVYMEGRRTC